MMLFRARPWVVAVGLVAACGGQSRGPETGPSGAVGGRDGDACGSGQNAYQQKRSQVLQKLASAGCTSDADCGTLWETNACVSTCGVAAPIVGIDAAARELGELARDECSSCAPIPVPPCTPPQPIKCLQGQCVEGG